METYHRKGVKGHAQSLARVTGWVVGLPTKNPKNEEILEEKAERRF